MNKRTREDRLLELLADRMWHTREECMAAAGHRFSTVIHDLRERDFTIESEQVIKDQWRYRLDKTPEEQAKVVRVKSDGQALLGFEDAA